MTAYLKLDHIDKIFTRGAASTEVLKDINLTIEKGEYVSIIGHSGCGKSTLLNIIAGLTNATMGGVLLENREVNSPGPDRAVVFQNHSLLPWLTVYENVRQGVDKVFAKTKKRAERLVEQQDLRLHRQRSGDADALLHAAGDFRRTLVPGVGHLH
jgi:nitrate/nitrite transport system ATP-binding protein